ncbi:hypothetical protein DFH08DRAFT_967662 [Mycena albidolilacea]|uniref:DUF6534 domain-containing protein n=1 Tax=Mycena albidolilacea TaxID=1033008 RepID=A0AAD7EI48_9AGAR|nr:hypothetical protein DFH08DRAFT_967662 [Mycena albidolilacea]
MPLPALDTITGALLIATWANSFLYMAELIQAMYYFRHFKHDDWKLKMFVSVAVLYTITHAGDPVYLADQHWPLSLHLFTTAVIAILIQSFLVVRYWRLTRNILVTLLNSFLVIVALGGSFACAVILAMFPAFKDREKIKIPATIWLVTEAVVDLSIAAALLWQLRKIRPTLVETQSVLDRLVALTIQSGTATTTLAVAALIGFLWKEESNISTGFAYTLGRVYVLSMLANLNVWRSGRSASASGGGVSSPACPGTLTVPSFIVTDDFGGSHFHHTVNIGSQEAVTLTSSCAESLRDDSRPAGVAVAASHLPRKQSVVVGNSAGN